jgi:tripartite-type tricarboxylate transporter receptor subunit TctC
MQQQGRVARILSTCLLLAGISAAHAQPFPARPIRVVPAEAGAGGDFVSRMIAPGLAEQYGQQVIVDNRGGNAVIPIEIVAKAAPDGYTLLVFGSALWLLPLLQNVTYHPLNDFAPVTLASSTPLLLVVHPSLPVKSIKELSAWARAKPGALNWGFTPSSWAGHHALARQAIIRGAAQP